MNPNTQNVQQEPQIPFMGPLPKESYIAELGTTAHASRQQVIEAMQAVQNSEDASKVIADAKQAIADGNMSTEDFQNAVHELQGNALAEIIASSDADDLLPAEPLEFVGANEYDINDMRYNSNATEGELRQMPNMEQDKAA